MVRRCVTPSTWCARAYLGTAFPYHTFIINITGSIVMGLIAGYLAFKGEASQPWRLFLMTGILGGYTTFSAFSLDTALLYERGEIGLALFYVLGSVVFSIAGPVRRPRAGAPSGLKASAVVSRARPAGEGLVTRLVML